MDVNVVVDLDVNVNVDLVVQTSTSERSKDNASSRPRMARRDAVGGQSG